MSYRSRERFLLCSTSKAIVVGAVLSDSAEPRHALGRALRVPARGLIAHSPVTAAQAGKTMTIQETCQAAIAASDNTAVNMLTAQAVTRADIHSFLTRLGDRTTHLDRDEPSLNIASGIKDTSTPTAFACTLSRILTSALPIHSREQLKGWMKPNSAVPSLIAQVLPKTWSVAHKSGKGAGGQLNDVAFITPPSGHPSTLAIFTTPTRGHRPTDSQAAIQEVTQRLAKRLA